MQFNVFVGNTLTWTPQRGVNISIQESQGLINNITLCFCYVAISKNIQHMHRMYILNTNIGVVYAYK